MFRIRIKVKQQTFKQWNRKTYSLFNVLHRSVRIGVLLVVYTNIAEPQQVFAQTDSSKISLEFNLEEVEVSVQRSPVISSQTARIVTVISKKEIEAAPVQSIQELLEYASNVDVRQRGTFGVQADVSIRGGSFDQTLILLNGINISDPQTGHHSLNLPIDIKNIQRIEILEGSSTRIFGPNAYSGVINIITGIDEDTNIKIGLSTGQNKLIDIDLAGNLKFGNITQLLAGNWTSSAGYTTNTDFKILNIFYQANYNYPSGKLGFQVGRTKKEFGANSFYSGSYPNQFESTQTTFMSLKFDSETNIHFTPSIYWRRHQDRFELFRSDSSTWPNFYKNHNYHLTNVFGSNLNAWVSSRLGKTAFGAEIRSENIWSNVLGEPMAYLISVPGEANQFFTKSYSRTIVSYFIEQSIYLRKFSISTGAMLNWISDLEFRWKIYPGIDVSYQIVDHFKIYGSASSSLRMPTFTDLYYNGPTNIGNPNLKPEDANSIEGGFKLSGKGFSGHVEIYYRNGKNMIDWVRKSETEKWQTINMTTIKSGGLEISGIVFPEQILNTKNWLSKFSFNYSFNELNKGVNEFDSYYVLDNLKHKIDIELIHKIYKQLNSSWSASYQDRNGMRTSSEDYQPFWLLNWKLTWRRSSTEIYIMASNLLGTVYFDYGTVEQPGRWISAGVNHRINYK